MDAPLGIEPRLPQSKCGVLPLDEGALAPRQGIEPCYPVLETGASPLNAFVMWPSRQGSNLQPRGSKPRTLSSCATGSGWSVGQDYHLRPQPPGCALASPRFHIVLPRTQHAARVKDSELPTELVNCGLGGRSRTSDLLIPNQALYQLSYTQKRGAAKRTQLHRRQVGAAVGRCWRRSKFMRGV